MHTIRTPEKRAEFLAALAQFGNVAEACRHSGIARNSAYLWRREDESFAEQWKEFLQFGAEQLEDEAIRRAREGWDEAVWHQGEQVGTVRKYSDTLLIFLLKGNMREKYGDQVKQYVNVNHTLSEEELAAKLSGFGVDVSPAED